jgi:tight adherence protein B
MILRQRMAWRMAAQLCRSLQVMIQAQKAGCSFLQSLQKTSEELEDPLGKEWRAVVHAVQLGVPLRTALNDLRQRVPLRDIGWFVTAVQVTQETGGSLCSILESLAKTLQEKEALRSKVSALTAQGKASGYILSGLPLFMLLALAVLAPEYVAPLFTTPTGLMWLMFILILIVVGSVLIHKIVTVTIE